MKYLSIMLFFIFSTTVVFSQSREVVDRTAEDAELDQYKTYDIGSALHQSQDQDWITFNALLNKMVENSIVYEFDTYGYNMDKENPDMLVSYQIYDKAYNEKVGYQPAYQN